MQTPILVTGSHRSGTTWVGRVLASSPGVAYIHEPFHPRHDPAVCAARFDRWFTYVCDENASSFQRPIAKMLLSAARPRIWPFRRTSMVPLVKDPIAVFSAGWLASTFRTRNLVMIRHPAAFAGSLKVKGWTHPFSDFLQQPYLMKHHLRPFAAEIVEFARAEKDIVDQAALLWAVIHSVILRYRETFPDWIYVRHEDLSRDPVRGFRSLCERLDLADPEAVERAAASFSSGERRTDDPANPRREDDLVRDSAANIDTWRARLTAQEIRSVRARVLDVSRHFYGEDEW